MKLEHWMKKGGQLPSFNKFIRLNNFLTTIDAESVHVNWRLFTWKKRIHTHFIYERPDHFIARTDWFHIYPEAFRTHDSFICSDHCPITLLTTIEQRCRKAFRFHHQNLWCKYHKVGTLIKKNWNINVSSTKMFQLAKKNVGILKTNSTLGTKINL